MIKSSYNVGTWHISVPFETEIPRKMTFSVSRTCPQATHQLELKLILSKVLEQYDDSSGRLTDDYAMKNRDIVLEALSDSGTVAPLIMTANLHSRANPKSYMYVFSHPKAMQDYSGVSRSPIQRRSIIARLRRLSTKRNPTWHEKNVARRVNGRGKGIKKRRKKRRAGDDGLERASFNVPVCVASYNVVVIPSDAERCFRTERIFNSRALSRGQEIRSFPFACRNGRDTLILISLIFHLLKFCLNSNSLRSLMSRLEIQLPIKVSNGKSTLKLAKNCHVQDSRAKFFRQPDVLFTYIHLCDLRFLRSRQG